MAIIQWRGPGGKPGARTSGDYAVAANWAGGVVPDRLDDVVFARGDYVVRDSEVSMSTASISVGAGVRLEIVGDDASIVLRSFGQSLNAGTLLIANGSFVVGQELRNAGTITGASAGNIFGTALANAGLLETQANRSFAFAVAAATTNTGTILARDGAMRFGADLANAGQVTVLGGSIVTYASGTAARVTNLANGVLTGGGWLVDEGGTLGLTGSAIERLADGTTVALGAGAFVTKANGQSGTPTVAIGDSLTRVDAGATLRLLAGSADASDGVAFARSLSAGGTIALAAGQLVTAGLRIEAGARLTGFGTVGGPAQIDGLARADAGATALSFTGDTTFTGTITGRGTLTLATGDDTIATADVGVRALTLGGASVTLANDLSYAGRLTLAAGSLDLKDSDLTLSGAAVLKDGSIVSHGGVLALGGAVAVRGGEVSLAVRTLAVDGTIAIDHGMLVVGGTVTGDGGFTVGVAGVLEFNVTARLGDAPAVTLAGPGATLAVDALGATGLDVIDFGGTERIAFTQVAPDGARALWTPDVDGSGGTLTIANAKASASVHLEENHAQRDFRLADDRAGGTIVTLGRTAPAFAHVSAEAFGDDAQHFPAAAMPHHPAGLELVLA